LHRKYILSGYPHDPRRPDHEEHKNAERRREETQTVKFALGQIAAGDKNDILAATLRRDRGEIAARKEERESHKRRWHPSTNPDVEEYAEQSQDLRGLADEQVMQ
jgi:hypothetical protein